MPSIWKAFFIRENQFKLLFFNHLDPTLLCFRGAKIQFESNSQRANAADLPEYGCVFAVLRYNLKAIHNGKGKGLEQRRAVFSRC